MRKSKIIIKTNIKGGKKMSILMLICSITVISYLITYALVCVNSPKMIFFEIKGITNRWMYLEEVPPIFSLWDKKEV